MKQENQQRGRHDMKGVETEVAVAICEGLNAIASDEVVAGLSGREVRNSDYGNIHWSLSEDGLYVVFAGKHFKLEVTQVDGRSIPRSAKDGLHPKPRR
jgi:hypothetical protein